MAETVRLATKKTGMHCLQGKHQIQWYKETDRKYEKGITHVTIIKKL